MALIDVMPSFPLLFHSSPDQTIAWRDGAPVPVREFLADVARVARSLPAGEHVFNMCTDRYRFAVGLCATLVARKISLLPSAHTPAAVRQLAAFAPDTFCLHDSADCSVDLPRFRFPASTGPTGSNHADTPSESDDIAIPQIDASQVMAYLFTSGSTGVPVPHGKKWGFLVKCLRTSAQRLGLLEMGHCTLVGTVPPQHMYGFETTVLLALIGGFAFSNRQPFYPSDVAGELAAVPQPRVLVTSPVHLRALMLSGLTLPPVSLALSATAPLGQDLASRSEAQLGAPLLEIYGSTESGQIATRRTAQSALWHLYPEIRLEARRTTHDGEDDDAAWVSGGHIEEPVPMGDALELIDERHFLLHGRKADLINIAGKRTSLAYLNHQLTEIAGVVDGVFFMPDENLASSVAARGDHITRLMAFVVAPALDTATLQRALRERIDAAFMPRPLVFVDSLPRNATGKLPRDVLTALVAQHARGGAHAALKAAAHSTLNVGADATGHTDHRLHETLRAASAITDPEAALTFTIPHDHPAIPGHFPGRPIVPGVMLLDHAISAMGAALSCSLDACRLSSAKFLNPAQPGEPLTLTYAISASGAIRFKVSAGARTVASGVLAAPTQPARAAASSEMVTT